jgi:hypothetical protein
MDFKDLYRVEADRHKISEAVLEKTKQKMYEKNKPARRYAIRTAVIVGLLIGCMTITAFAYEYHQYTLQNNNAGRDHKYLNAEEEKNMQQVNKTATGENISITVKTVAADEKNLYALVALKTMDSSSLNINTEEDITVLERQGFEKAYFTVDGKSIDFTTGFRIDDGSDPSSAVIELVYNAGDSDDSLKDISGKEIKIVLQNYQYEVNSTKSIGFTYSDSGTMLEKEGLASDDEFSEVGVFIKYANGNCVYSYTLASGNKKIYFSKQYSKTYIDNAGIYESGEGKKKSLYISIVPESSEVKEKLLKNLVLFNKVTGEYIYPQQPYIEDSDGNVGVVKNSDGTETYITDAGNVQPQDGRIVLIFDAGMGVYNAQEDCYGVDTTLELLKNYIFKLYTSSRIETVKNKWEIDFTLKSVNEKLIYEPDMELIKGEGSIRVNTIEVSDTFISIQGKGSGGLDLKPVGKIYLLLEDGTKIDAGSKISGGYEGGTGEFDMDINLKTFVNAEDVTGIILWDQTIPLE